MKIAFFTQNLSAYISGGRQYPWLLAHALANAGHELLIVTDWLPIFDRDFNKLPNRNNIKIHHDLFFGSKNKQIMNDLKSFDLFIASPMVGLDYAVTVAKMYNKKVIGLVYEPHNMLQEAIDAGVEIPTLDENIVRDFGKQLYKTDMIICNNQTTLDYMKLWFPNYRGRIEHCYNGFNNLIADTVSTKERENAVVFISRTVKYKGFGDIPYIFGQIKNKVKIHYVSGFIDPNSPEHHGFFKLCKDAGLDLVVHDKCTEVEKFNLLASSKALFFPSRFEGFGIPPAEAFYMGTPVICYDLPVLKEVYKNFPHYMPFGDVDYGITLMDQLLSDDKLLFRDIDEAKKNVEFAKFNNLANRFNKLICMCCNAKYETINIVEPIKSKSSFSVQLQDIHIIEATQLNHTDFSSIKEKYILIKDVGVKLDEKKIAKEVSIRMIEDKYDFITFNYKFKDKEIRIVENSMDAQFAEPGHLGGVVICRKESLMKYSNFNLEEWELDLALKANEDKWFHSNLFGFTISEQHVVAAPIATLMIKRYLDKNSLHWDINNVGEFNCLKNRAKTLIIVPARTNTYLPKLVEGLSKLNPEIYKIVLCLHEPKGQYCEEAIKTFSKLIDSSIIKFDGEFNFSKMNNEAFKQFGKDCEYVILCNDDIVLNDNTISNLIGGFKYRFKNIGIVGCKLLYPIDINETFTFEECWYKDKHMLQHGGVIFFKDKGCTHFSTKKRANKLAVNYFKLYPAVTFGLVAIDAECYESLKLREDYPNDLNDIDFCVRASRKKWDILYNPYAVAYHLETATRKQFKMTSDYGNQQKFHKEYKDLLDKQMSMVEVQQMQYNLY